mgnify:CR=1 FL=1|tara:strand:- start:296 stop:760 length:465 start_codon:yes stop_codon:yes gene_type:complete
MATVSPYNPTPHDGSGTTVTFQPQTTDNDGNVTSDGDPLTFIATGLVYNMNGSDSGEDDIDVSNLGQATGEEVLTQPRPLIASTTDETGREFQLDFIGTAVPNDGQKGVLTITGKISWTGQAKVSSSSVTWAVNDVFRGQITFEVEKKDYTVSV